MFDFIPVVVGGGGGGGGRCAVGFRAGSGMGVLQIQGHQRRTRRGGTATGASGFVLQPFFDVCPAKDMPTSGGRGVGGRFKADSAFQ